jgi:hypothetical protein
VGARALAERRLVTPLFHWYLVSVVSAFPSNARSSASLLDPIYAAPLVPKNFAITVTPYQGTPPPPEQVAFTLCRLLAEYRRLLEEGMIKPVRSSRCYSWVRASLFSQRLAISSA